ncbi:MAG: FAD-dependent oxidoreductase, partial [Burkholderiales bacterium]|nr:FAD-dependent oxidoreductase [Burkholderiales bacterium]
MILKSLIPAIALSFAGSLCAAQFTPGTYTAIEDGVHGPVKVSVKFSADKIEDVTVDPSHQETIGIGTVAIEQLPAEIIKAQSVKVDSIAGASITSNAILKAVSNCITQAGADPNKLNVQNIAKAAPAQTLHPDIVGVGSGIAGMVAAINSAEHGAKVILLEKMPFLGAGASGICGGQFAVAGSKLQKSKGVEYDPPQALVYDIIGNGHNYNNLTSLKLLAENLPRSVDWAIDKFNLQFEDQPMQYRAEFQNNRTIYLKDGCAPMAETLRQAVRKTDIDVLTNTRANKLIVENGRVVGVEATGKDGAKYTVLGKAVLLATGGYGANKDMLVEPLKSALYYGPVSATGDGHKMAAEIGAPLELMEFGKRYPNGIEAAPGQAKSIIQGNYRALLKSGILVDAKGNRVINEKASNNTIMQLLEKMPHQTLFLVMDKPSFDGFVEGVHTLGITDGELEKWLAANGSEPPLFAHGETLEEAATHVGINAENLKKTIERYNGFVKNGKDEDFGRPKAFMKETVLDQGPYYIVEQKPRFATTMGSVKITDALQVLGKDGKPIPGLYAAGEITNALHGDDSSAGMNVAWGFT